MVWGPWKTRNKEGVVPGLGGSSNVERVTCEELRPSLRVTAHLQLTSKKGAGGVRARPHSPSTSLLRSFHWPNVAGGQRARGLLMPAIEVTSWGR